MADLIESQSLNVDNSFSIEDSFSTQQAEGMPGTRETSVSTNSMSAFLSTDDPNEFFQRYTETMNLSAIGDPAIKNPFGEAQINAERDLRVDSLYDFATQAGIDAGNEKFQQLLRTAQQVDGLDVAVKRLMIADEEEHNNQGAYSLEENEINLAATLNETSESLKALENAQNVVKHKFYELQKARSEGSVIPPTAYELGFYFIPLVDSFMTYAMANGLLLNDKSIGAFRRMKAAALPGEARHELKQWYDSLDVDGKIEFHKKAAEYISNVPGTVIGELGLNSLEEIYEATTSIESESAFSRFLYNALGIADIFGAKWTIGRFARRFRGKKGAETVKAAEEVYTTLNESYSPTARSPQTVADATNKITSYELKQLANEASKGGADDLVEAITGVSNNPNINMLPTNGPVIRNQNMPMLTVQGNLGGRVNRSQLPKVAADADSAILGYSEIGTSLSYSPDEISQISANLERQLNVAINQPTGVNGSNVAILNNSVSVTDVGDASVITGQFGRRATNGTEVEIRQAFGNTQTPSNYWNNANEAISDTLFALRDFGATEDNLLVMKKVGSMFEQYNPAIHSADGEFLVQYAQRIKHTLANVDDLANINISWLDRVINRIPSLSRLQASSYLLDASARFDALIQRPLTVAVHRADRVRKLLTDNANEFFNAFKALDKGRQSKLVEFIEKANLQQIDPTRTAMLAEGFTQNEIAVHRLWKRHWDTAYEVENRLLRDYFKREGYRAIEGSGQLQGASGKPVSRSNAKSVSSVYDPDADLVLKLDSAAIDNIYQKGGQVLELRRPTTLGGESTQHVIVRNNGQNYHRAYTDTDRVLSYLPGYYTRQYKAGSKFIDASNADGITNTVGIAKDTRSAEIMAENLRRQNPDLEFKVRNDRITEFGSNEYFDEITQQGRLSTRYRGQPLIGSTVNEGLLIDPFEALTKNIRSVSEASQIPREIENITQRVTRLYEDLLPTRNGQKYLPKDVRDIVVTSNKDLARAAELRSYINYIRQLTDGYANLVDDSIKAAFNNASAVFGELATKVGDVKLANLYSGIERGLATAGTKGLSGYVRSAASTAFIGWNPLRQLLLQPAQSLQMIGVYPTGWATGRIPQLAVDYVAHMFGRNGNANVQQYARIAKESGLFDGVDAHLLLNNTGKEFAQYSNEIKAGMASVKDFLVDWPRKLGMEAGEAMNRHMHFMTVYQRAVDNGVDLTIPRNVENLIAEAMDFMGNLHRAASLTYNNNSLSVVAQFMQVPQKIGLAWFNRSLSKADRAKLFAANLAIYGLPLSYAVDQIFGLSEKISDPETRYAINQGLLGVAINVALGQDISTNPIDVSSMSPIEGWINLTGAFDVMNEPIFDLIIQSTPAVNLGKKFVDIAKNFASWTHIYDEFQQPDSYVNAETMARSVFNLSSGVSNTTKAIMAYKLGYAVDNQMKPYDFAPFDGGAFVAQLFGLPLKTVQDYYNARRELFKLTEERKSDLRTLADNAINRYAEVYSIPATSDEEIQAEQVVRRWLFTSAVPDDDYEGQRYLLGYIKQRMADKTDTLYQTLDRATGGLGQNLSTIIENAPGMTEEDRKRLRYNAGIGNSEEK